MLFLNKRPEVSDEKFHSHWKTTHVEIALSNRVFRSKVARYSQFHTSPELKEQAAGFQMPVLSFDGIAEVWVDSIDEWREIVSDPEFLEKIVPDEGNFIQPPINIMVGYENLVIGDSLELK